MLERDTSIIRFRKTAHSIGAGARILLFGCLVGFMLVACSKPSTTEQNAARTNSTPTLYTVEQVRCDAVSVEDAAAILGVEASAIEARSEELYPGNTQCTFEAGGSLENILSFNISVAETVDEAANEMDQYRSHLEVARETEPFEDDLAEGAYSDIEGLGDEAIWTKANKTLTVRKGNVSLQVLMPNDRDAQVAVVKKFLKKL